MRKIERLVLCALLVLALFCAGVPASASNVSYSGDAGQFIFTPGSNLSVTDLFTGFKDVMPGDTLTQTIVVRNNASDKVSVRIYLRALGAQEQSQDFLSRLSMSVTAGEKELFHAPAHEKAQLIDWVELGTFSGGGEVALDVSLHVPVTLDNGFMDAVGYLDWQFMVEELSVDQPGVPDQPDIPDQPDQPEEPQKPDVPKTGDNVNVGLFAGLFAGSGLMIAVLLWLLWKKKKNESD